MTKIYVGGLSYSIKDADLQALFAEYGTVASARIITDRDSGQSKGFGFVEMENAAEAKASMEALNGKEVEGRSLTVNEARPQVDRR